MGFICDYKNCKSKCCNNLRGNSGIDNYDLDDKRVIHLVIPPSRLSIGIDSHEKEVLELKARELGIKLVISPIKIVVTKDNIPKVLRWHIDHDTCPFLDNEYNCQAYHERPLICRAFPLIPKHLSFTRKFNLLEMSNYCPATLGLELHNFKTNPDNTNFEFHSLFDEAYHAYELVHEYNDELEAKVKEAFNKGELLMLKTRTAIRIYEAYNEKLEAFH